MVDGLQQVGGVQIELVSSIDVPLDRPPSVAGLRYAEQQLVMGNDGSRRMVLRYLHMGADTQRGKQSAVLLVRGILE